MMSSISSLLISRHSMICKYSYREHSVEPHLVVNSSDSEHSYTVVQCTLNNEVTVFPLGCTEGNVEHCSLDPGQ